jgi:hypothetical protein
MLNNAIRENVALSYKDIRSKSPLLKHLIDKGELKVVAGVYTSRAATLNSFPLSPPRRPIPINLISGKHGTCKGELQTARLFFNSNRA